MDGIARRGRRRARSWPAFRIVVLCLALSSPAVAQSAPTSPHTVPFTHYRPQLYTEDDCVLALETASLRGWEDSEKCCAWAPVDLPDGVTVTAMVGHLLKEVSGDDFSMQLKRKDLGNTVPAEVMAEVSSTGLPISSQVRIVLDGSVADPVIDNSAYSYFVATGECIAEVEHGVYSLWLFFD